MSDGHDERRNPEEELKEAASAPTTGQPEGDSPSTSGDVLSLIEDVERHLARIRDVQNQQESEFMDLAGRQRSIEEAEAILASRGGEIEAASSSLAQEREEFDRMRAELASDRGELDERRRLCDEANAELESSQAELAAARNELQGDLSEHRAEMDAWAAKTHALEEERGAIEELKAELEEREQALAERSAEHLAMQARISELEGDAVRRREADRLAAEAHDRSLAEATAVTHRHREALESVGRELEQAQSELADARDRSETLETELESIRNAEETSAQENSTLQATIAEFESRCRTFDEQNHARQTSLDAALERTATLEDELAAARSRVEELEGVVEEDRRQLGLAGRKLTELARAVAEQAPRLEQGTAAIAIAAEQQERIERLEARLASEGTDANEAVAGVRDALEARIAELESALEQAPAGDVDEASMQSAVDAVRGPLEARISELERLGADPAAVEAATAPLLAEIETLRSRMKGFEQSEGGVPTAELEAFEERCRRAEQRSDELETALAMTNDRGQAQEMAKRLRAKAERINAAARHLDRRKRRLAAVKRRVRNHVAEDGGSATFHELQRLEAQRKELSQVREFLSRSEQQMIRRWARSRSVAMVAWMGMLAAVCVAGSWFAVSEIVPVAGTASVELRATPRDGGALTNDAASTWREWHEALATDPAFVRAVGRRLAARGLMPTGGETGLATILGSDLQFETDGPGRMRLVLEGPDRRVLPATLDAIATTMASESARQAPRRADGARASLRGDQPTTAGGGYARLMGGQMPAALLSLIGMIAGVSIVASLLLIGLVYLMLSRAKRIFDASHEEEEGVIAA
ncbi:MAG: hypothetical protein CMJ54_02040 [Planctomycetaceae bacterium]|nr:hypothetical protein [Planctomycetaceae bacterium]